MTTGQSFEQCIGAVLRSVYIEVDSQHLTNWVGLFGQAIRLDFLCTSADSSQVAVEVKWQETRGTTDQKIVFAIEQAKLYPIPSVLILGGTGWSRGCKEYAIAQSGGNLIGVFDSDRFFAWAMKRK